MNAHEDPLLVAVGRILKAELMALRAAMEGEIKALRAELAILELKQAEPGERGKRGEPGRDALELEILENLDAAKVYPRGTFARHAGGLVRAYRTTEPIGERGLEAAGWQVVVNGIACVSGARASLRKHDLTFRYTDGTEAVYGLPVASLVYRGIWADGEYEAGDTVTWDGQLFHCNSLTSDPPGQGSAAWTLAVRKGRDAGHPMGPAGRKGGG